MESKCFQRKDGVTRTAQYKVMSLIRICNRMVLILPGIIITAEGVMITLTKVDRYNRWLYFTNM